MFGLVHYINRTSLKDTSMDALLFLAVTGILVSFGLAAFAWGVDSRDDSTDSRRSDYPVGISA